MDWYEAAALFALYILYGIFMKYNAKIERIVKRRFPGTRVGVEKPTLVKVNSRLLYC